MCGVSCFVGPTRCERNLIETHAVRFCESKSLLSVIIPTTKHSNDVRYDGSYGSLGPARERNWAVPC